MKRLFLSSSDKKIGGVCGGIADYLAVDATVVRLVVVILAIITGFLPFTLGYLVAWAIIPRKQ
ncbi:MAG TPA: PspC domain-containing protein [Bacteroidota bacterium]|nr:PspC domain-containing protein [Bacteroidota bacterium]